MRACHTDNRARDGAVDNGATYIEILVSLVLLGIGAIAVLVSMTASIRGASVHGRVAEAQSWLATAGDALVEVPPQSADTYMACTVPSNAPAIVAHYQNVIDAVAGIPADSDIRVVDVEFWNSTIEGFGTDCRYSALEEDRLQRITLATSVAGANRELAIVKRPALAPSLNLGTPPTTLGGGNYEPEPNPDLQP